MYITAQYKNSNVNTNFKYAVTYACSKTSEVINGVEICNFIAFCLLAV